MHVCLRKLWICSLAAIFLLESGLSAQSIAGQRCGEQKFLAPSSKAISIGQHKLNGLAASIVQSSKTPELPPWLQKVSPHFQGKEAAEEEVASESSASPELPFPNMYVREKENRERKAAGLDPLPWKPEWVEFMSLCAAILSICPKQGTPISLTALRPRVESQFRMHGLQFSNEKFIQLLNKLRSNDVVSNYPRNQEFLAIGKENKLVLNFPPRLLAVWAGNVEYIGDDLKYALAAGGDQLLDTVLEYEKAIEKWPRYPVEIKYPVLQAISLMDKEVQEAIHSELNAFRHESRPPLIDAILLLFDTNPQEAYPDSNWLHTQAPELEGRTIYMVAPEISLLAGGLGRVTLYHSRAMKSLGADVAFIEPDYMHEKDGREINYEKAAARVYNPEDLGVFHTIVQGQGVLFRVIKGINEYGIPVYRIRDIHSPESKRPPIVDVLYRYQSKEYPDSVERDTFVEFFSKASTELIRRLEEKAKQEKGDKWKAPVVQAHDGQSVPLAAWLRIWYANKENGITGPVVDYMKQLIMVATTHTYKNRCSIEGDFREVFEKVVKNFNIPRDFLWLFVKKWPDGAWGWDFTSAGERSALLAQAVSAIHASEVGYTDPNVKLVAQTNGDDREYSTEYFTMAARTLGFRRRPEDLKPEEVAKVKRQAKVQISKAIPDIKLNPDQMVVSYSGRLVPEKAGREKAFTNENIKKMVQAGIQVVILSNEQDYPDSIKLRQQFRVLENEIAALKAADPKSWPGRFIFRNSFKIDEQRMLLAATDVQVQYSDRATGAAEFTESDVTSNGGLQLSPPYWEGIIGKQGIPVNWERMSGNTLVPYEDTREAFINTILRAKGLYSSKDPKHHLSVLQANSLKISRILEAELTAASYLRSMQDLIAQFKKGEVKPVEPHPLGELDVKDVDLRLDVGQGNTYEGNREGTSFNILGEGKSEISVTVDNMVADLLNGDPGAVPPDMIQVRLVDDSGKVINLRPQRDADEQIVVKNNRIVFTATLENYPVDGRLEITSGVAWSKKPLKITNMPKPRVFEEIKETVAGEFTVREVSPVAVTRDRRIIYKSQNPVVLEIEFPWDHETLIDAVEPVLYSNAFGRDWDAIGEDELLFSEFKYEKLAKGHGKFVWRVAFVPRQDGEMTFQIAVNGFPQDKSHQIWFGGPGKNLQFTTQPIPEGQIWNVKSENPNVDALLTMQGQKVACLITNRARNDISGLEIEIPTELIKAGYVPWSKIPNSTELSVRADGKRILRIKKLKGGDTQTILFELPETKVAEPSQTTEERNEQEYQNILKTMHLIFPDAIFPPWQDVENADGDVLMRQFFARDEIRGNPEVPYYLSLIGDIVEQNTPAMADDLKYKVAIVMAKNLAAANFVLPARELKAWWDQLSALGFSKDFQKIVAVLAGMRDKTIFALNEEELAVIYLLSSIQGDKEIRKDLKEMAYPVSEQNDFLGRLGNTILQYEKAEKMMESLGDKKLEGTIVVSAEDINVGICNFLLAVRKNMVGPEDLKIVVLLRGLDAAQRIKMMKKRLPFIFFAEDIEEVHGENIVCVSKSFEKKNVEELRQQGVKLLEFGNAGPMLELSLALQLLSEKNVYGSRERLSITPHAAEAYVQFLRLLVENRVLPADTDLKALRDQIEHRGYFKLPVVRAFQTMWGSMEEFLGVEAAA